MARTFYFWHGHGKILGMNILSNPSGKTEQDVVFPSVNLLCGYPLFEEKILEACTSHMIQLSSKNEDSSMCYDVIITHQKF